MVLSPGSTGRWDQALAVLTGGVALALAALVLTGARPAPEAASLDEARDILRGPATVSVLGDSTGNEPGEWVDLWARDLGKTRSVTLHRWEDARDGWDPDVLTIGSNGPRITIWNGSRSGAQASYPLGRLDQMQPARPDLVVYSFGHNHWPGKVVAPMQTLADSVERRWPGRQHSVVILQNPETGARAATHQAVEDEVGRWARAAHLPIIDVLGAFQSRTSDAGLLKDAHHPSVAGSRLWADVVGAALS